jgi:hypothetical protein
LPRYLQGTLSAHLPPLRLVSRARQEYAGACPFCGGDERRSDRFHVWLLPAGRERYWCRRCNRKGPTSEFLSSTRSHRPSCAQAPVQPRPASPVPQPEHIPHYRALYAAVAAWAEQNLYQPWNPEPLTYLQQRGFDLATIRWARLGYGLHDPYPLVHYLERHTPALLPFAEAAGVLCRDDHGTLRAHTNLCGRLVLPYLHHNQVLDLRSRRVPGSGYRSLPGSYAVLGATVPYCWDAARNSEVVIITEGEFKALAVTAAYRNGCLPCPAISHPGLSYFRTDWAAALARHGVRVAILAYDARADRPRDEQGHPQLAPEEVWTLRHGATLTAAGLQVLVLSLPLAPGAVKEDLDGFLLRYGPPALSYLLHWQVHALPAYAAQLPPALVCAAGLTYDVRS